MPRTGRPANPTPKPRKCPSMPATHTPTRYSPPHQAGRLASPSTKAKPLSNQHCILLNQDPLARAQRPPNRRIGHRSQGPRSKEIQAIPIEPKRQPQHPPIVEQTETTRASQAVKQAPRSTTPPTTVPNPASATLGGKSHWAQDHPLNTTACHTMEDRTQQSKSHAQSPHCANALPPAQNKAPRHKSAPPRKEGPQHLDQRLPDTHTLARSCPTRKPTPKPTKGREPTEPKPKPTEKPRPVHPEINPGQPARPNRAVPSNIPPPDRTGTSIRNRKADKEPELEPEPPRSKRYLSLSKANHPPPPQNKTYTQPFEQLPEYIRPYTPRLTPLPPTDPPPCQQNALLEGESTCNGMVPTRQFRRPLSPPMHRRPGYQSMHRPKAPATYPPGPKLLRPSQDPSPEATRPRNPVPPSPPQIRPGAARHQASNWQRLPKSIACSHQMSCLRAAKAPPRLGPQPLMPDHPSPGILQYPKPRHPRTSTTMPQDEAKGAPPLLGDGVD
ncbi:hypothetical protein CRENBAI_012823 [Crenichthys baileyi]|uniref:Uncharacterized protein n=1 Tax=Crenichthys baileyi TaxID=28760 RepID=A0AAV9RJY4_9TELE